MARIRLLGDVPEGARGCEVVVSTSRARDLERIGQAVRVADGPRDRKPRPRPKRSRQEG